MSAWLTKAELLASLQSKGVALGLGIEEIDGDGFSGKLRPISEKWLFGNRDVTYQMSCHLDEFDHIVQFREAVIERNRGLPPPAFIAERTTVKGWALAGVRTDRSVIGRWTIDYGQVREEFEQLVAAAGWNFHFEGGRLPT